MSKNKIHVGVLPEIKLSLLAFSVWLGRNKPTQNKSISRLDLIQN